MDTSRNQIEHRFTFDVNKVELFIASKNVNEIINKVARRKKNRKCSFIYWNRRTEDIGDSKLWKWSEIDISMLCLEHGNRNNNDISSGIIGLLCVCELFLYLLHFDL